MASHPLHYHTPTHTHIYLLHVLLSAHQDFVEMKKLGLNTIRLPVGWWFFAPFANVNPAPYTMPEEELYDFNHPITQLISWAKDAGIHVSSPRGPLLGAATGVRLCELLQLTTLSSDRLLGQGRGHPREIACVSGRCVRRCRTSVRWFEGLITGLRTQKVT
jgi:hypothetical protein